MIRILFVDDDPEIRDIVKEYLEIHSDFIVDTADSAKEALFRLEKNSYHAIISDYVMPDMDGIIFLKTVRSINPHIPFIIFTGHGEEGVVIEALNNGADFYLKKSYEVKNQFFELAQIIRISVARADSEELLRKSEEKFRTIAEYSHEWMYWIDREGGMNYVSPSCEQVTGYTQEEFYQDPDLVNRIVYEDDRSLWDSHQEDYTNEASSRNLDYRIVHKNGEIRWLAHVCQSIFDTTGKYAGRRVSNRDITTRKITEDQLLKERDNFLRVFRAAPVGLLLININTEIAQANEAISEMILREPADIIRKRSGEVLGCVHSQEDPRGCGYSSSCPDCPLRTSIESVILEGISIHGSVIPLNLMIEGIPSLRWLRINAEPIDLQDAQYVIVAIDDITKEREMAIALRESEEKFHALSDSTTAGIMMYQDDRWTYANPAAIEISGYSREELLSMRFWDIIHPDYRETIIAKGQARQQGGEILSPHTEIIIRRKNGEERWVDIVGSTITIGQKIAGLVTAVDITDRKIAEQQLELSEEKYRLIFENNIDLFFRSDMDGTILLLSPSCKKLTGWEVHELVGTSAYNLYQDPQARTAFTNLLLLNENVYDYETLMINKAGNQIPVSITGHIFRDKEGTPVWIEGTIRNISERKKIEEALRRSEEHYRSLFDNMLEGFAYCKMIYDEQNLPVDWIYLEVNDSFGRITDLTDINGKLVTEAIPGIREQTPELFEMYNQVVLSGVPETFEIHFTPLKKWLKISVYRPETGHFVAVFEDITDRKNAEMNLQKIIRDHQTILDNVPSMIWYKDINNKYIKVNPAAARGFGRPIQEIEGRTFSELFPGVPDRYYLDDLEVIASKKAKIGIVEDICPHGEQIFIQTDKVPLFDNQGEVIGVLAVSTDITERKLAKDAITQANKKLNLLSGITRHDIGNQLQLVFGYLGFVKESDLDPDVRRYVEKVDAAAHNIKRQIAFTKDYEDIGVHSPVWQDIKEVISKVVQPLDLTPIQLRIKLSGTEVYADPLMEKVFYNLIDNARQYGETITEIQISGFEVDKGYTLVVEDDGIGIPTEFKTKIFNREYFKHTGFGLNLSREILEITGLSIRECGTPGKGARFEILVPEGKYRKHQVNPS